MSEIQKQAGAGQALRRGALMAVLLWVANSVWAQPAVYWDMWDRSGYAYQRVNHSAWQQFLRNYLVVSHDSGIHRVRYSEVTQADQTKLAGYIESLAALNPRQYEKVEQKAYWVNLYNALVVQQMVAEAQAQPQSQSQPNVKTTTEKALLEAKQQPLNRLERKLVTVQDTLLSLNDIKHRILRPLWKDYKVHFVLCDGTLSAPSLPSVAFDRYNIEQELDRAAKSYVGHPRSISFKDGTMTCSYLFKECQEDFANSEKEMFRLLAFYANDRTALYLLGFKGDVKYRDDPRSNGL